MQQLNIKIESPPGRPLYAIRKDLEEMKAAWMLKLDGNPTMVSSDLYKLRLELEEHGPSLQLIEELLQLA